ncbi:MAG: 5-nitroimidazole antibiotic resistance protein [Angelakisella sp.]|jgi:nitroimidazol reductase NimA-like FMN-containing flavoprotein (pyridoxamine 5'-phosphate oxidase superfamily)|nr:5-nitroimidazole antibiotic resistance protein [Angelakisella sp.]
MFREMRRKKQLLPEEEAIAILKEGTFGVLALSGDDGYPYAVPISYVYEGGKLWFHCAKSGHKLDAIRREPKASFCVTAQDKVVPEEYTTYFRSVIAFGTIRVLEGEEMRPAIERLALKYSPLESEESRREEIEKTWKALCILELEVEHLTGKEAIELTRQRG